MRVALLVILFALCAIPTGTAQSLPQFGGGGAANYGGYAFVECTAANKPAVRLVLMQGVVPKDLPASAPRPSLAVILPGNPDSVAGKEVTVSKDPAGPGQMVSCPVVGACVVGRNRNRDARAARRRRDLQGPVQGDVAADSRALRASSAWGGGIQARRAARSVTSAASWPPSSNSSVTAAHASFAFLSQRLVERRRPDRPGRGAPGF